MRRMIQWFVGAHCNVPLRLIIFILTINNLHADAFERVGIGTRAIGMGGAYVAVCNDVTSIFWNPAGLVNVYQDEIVFSHNNYLNLDVFNYNFLGFARTYVGPGALGLAWVHLGTKAGNAPENFNEETIYLSYGFNLFNGFSAGITVKYFLANYNHVKGAGYGVDYGFLYNLWDWIYIGLNYYNANNPQINWQTYMQEYLKSDMDFGIYYKMFEQIYFSYELANVLQSKSKNEHHIGCDGVILQEKLDLYLGAIYYWNKKISYTGGLEFRYKSINVGYSLYYHYELRFSHTWSIKLAI